jgi:hypothetical protein
MKRFLLAGVTLIFVIGLAPQPAHAQNYGWSSWNSFGRGSTTARIRD